MERWVWYAIISMLFAGATAIMPRSELRSLTTANVGWLALSGALAAISRIARG